MEVLDLTIYRGRNIYSHKTTMKMVVDIGEYGMLPTKDIDGFNERLLKAFPNLKTNCCGLGYAGGFLDRLNEGTYLAHVLEHVIIDMQNTLGYDVRYGKTRVIEEPSVYYLVYQYENEVCGLECGKAAVFILNCFLDGEDIEIDEFMEYLKKVSMDADLGPSTSAIVQEAEKRDIPITRIGHDCLIQLGYGKYSRMIESTLTDATSCISADISCNKQLTKSILDDHKIPVPYGKVVYSEYSAQMAADEIGVPVVVKPFDANQGKGVHLNLKTRAEIRSAFKDASNYSKGIIVEQYKKGKDYRLLVVADKVRAAAERMPASVTGDGEHTIEQLVEITNLDKNRGEHHEKPLTKIRLDPVSVNVLRRKGLSVDYIPAAGEKIALRENGNLSTGGTAIDCTDAVHPDNADIAIRAANAIGVDIAGIDIVCEDISKSILYSGGAVVEVNTAPGIRMHLYPSEGKSRNVAKDIVDMLFPNDEAAKFPIVSVTGTNGKTTTVRLICHALSMTGKKVGMTSTSGTFINDRCICKGDNSGPHSAIALLSNKTIDAAVLETARGGIIREGLGYDLADVGIITNITEDHLGIDGIETIEDLAFVKSLVLEAVKCDGYAVLNAEDKMTDVILKRVTSNVILFSKNRRALGKYSDKDYIYVFADGGYIYIQDGKNQIRLMPLSAVPITYGGLIECNIENCLACVSALYALKVPEKTIVQGLKSFKQNFGRFEIVDMDGYKIMLDYAHNEAGYKEALKVCGNFDFKRLVGVIGMPGDRRDMAISAVGKMCAKAFDRIYIKEDKDPRGRKAGEVAELLYNSVIEGGFDTKDVIIIRDEAEALAQAVENAETGDLIVMLYEKIEPLWEILEIAKCKKPVLV